MHNLFISYELKNPEANAERVQRACRSLGNSTPLVANTWYINSQYNADEALRRIGGAFGEEDKVVIANTKTDSIVWLGLGDREAQRIRQNWNMSLKAPEPVAPASVQ